MIDTGAMRKGVTIELDGTVYQVLDFQHIKIGRGSAHVKVKLRDVRAGHTFERTFQAGERFPRATLEKRPVQYLYNEDNLYYFMDTESYEQFPLNREQIESTLPYLTDNQEMEIVFHQSEAIGVEMPNTVTLTVSETSPAFRGDTATGGTKPATLETGMVVNVPMYLETGTRVVVDTRTGQYVERA